MKAQRFVPAVIVLLLLGILAVVTILRKKGSLHTRASDPLRTIFLAQRAYASQHPEKGFASSLEDLGRASNGYFIDPVLASGAKSGYEFILWTPAPDPQGRVSRFFVVARPEKYHEGVRSFFIDESGVERFTTENRAAMVTDPPMH